jgi:AcrR family transcriptional regulator
MSTSPRLTSTLAERAVERAVADKRAELEAGMEHIVEATYELIEESGDLDPSMRQILAHTGLSTQSFYRHFRSKDELMLAVLDDGRRRLVAHLERRMQRAETPEQKVRAWVEGFVAQASDARAAARTRPFVVNEDRLAEVFPSEHEASVDQLVALLLAPLGELSGRPRPRSSSSSPRAGDDARAVYRLTLATLRDLLASRQKPSPTEVEHLVGFVLRGIGAES